MTTVLATFADRLREIGLRVELTTLPPTELVRSWQAGGFDLRTTFASSLPGAAFVLQRRLNQTQSPGISAAFSPRSAGLVDRLLDQRMSKDAADQLHGTINRLMVEDIVGLEVCRLRNDVAAHPGVVGIDDLPFATLNLFDVTNVTNVTNVTAESTGRGDHLKGGPRREHRTCNDIESQTLDAHVHFWDRRMTTLRWPWLDHFSDHAPVLKAESYTARDYLLDTAALAVSGAVHVQAAESSDPVVEFAGSARWPRGSVRRVRSSRRAR